MLKKYVDWLVATKGKQGAKETLPPQTTTEETPKCPNCDKQTERHGAVYKCLNCGTTLGCS